MSFALPDAVRVAACLLLTATLGSAHFGCTGEVTASRVRPAPDTPETGRDDPEGSPPETPGVEPPPGRPPGQPPPLPPAEPLAPLVRRVTSRQLQHVLNDLLGVTLSSEVQAQLPEDRPLAGFAHLAEGQTALPDHVLAYAAMAQEVAQSPALEPFLDRYAACGDVAEADCARSFVEGAISLLFRGRTAPGAVDRIVQVYLEVAEIAESTDTARRAAMEVILQSPEFFYLLEDESEAPDDLAVAQRLAFGLWSSAPDEALIQAASEGRLSTDAGRVAAAERMLRNAERSARPWRRFVMDWARLASLPDEDGLKADLQASAEAQLRAHFANGGRLVDIFDGGGLYLTPALAEERGLEVTGPGPQPYSMAEGAFLTSPGVVAGMTNADGGAIVARGLFLQAQLFCTEPSDPPSSLQETIDEFAAEQPPDSSDRAITERRLMRNQCAACHAHFDPLALAFEGFDARGRPRTEDEFGNVIRTDGWIPAMHHPDRQDVPYAGLGGFLEVVKTSEQVERCLVRRWLELLLGRALGPGQERAVAALTGALAGTDGSYAAWIATAVQHPIFWGGDTP